MRPKCEVCTDGRDSVGEIQDDEIGPMGICQSCLAAYIEELFYPYNSGGRMMQSILELASKQIKDIVMV